MIGTRSHCYLTLSTQPTSPRWNWQVESGNADLRKLPIDVATRMKIKVFDALGRSIDKTKQCNIQTLLLIQKIAQSQCRRAFTY